MRRIRLALATFAVLAAAAPPASAQGGAGLLEIYAEAEGRVVGVGYRLKQLEVEAGVEGPKAEGVLCGVVADVSGLILVPGDVFPEPGGDPRETLVPAEFKIYLPGDKVFPATAVGIDRDLNVAYLRADPSALPLLRPAKFRDGGLEVGDSVVIVGVLGRKYGFAPALFRATINAAVKRPRLMFSVDALLQDLSVGGLVLRRDGTAAGIVVKDVISDDIEQNHAPGNLLSILATMGQPQSRRPGYAMVLPYGTLSASLASPPPLDLVTDVKRAWIGIVMQALNDDLREYWKLPAPGGIIIGSIVDGSPAQAAGLKPGDILTSIDGEPIRITEDAQLPDFRRRVEVLGVGRETQVEIYRQGRLMSLPLKLAAAPKTASRAEEYEDEDFGLTVREITIDIQQALNLDPDFEGVVVSDTQDAGWADVAGLSPDDVILSVNGAKVKTVADLRGALQEIKARRAAEAVLFVMRPPDTLFVRIKTDFSPHPRE